MAVLTGMDAVGTVGSPDCGDMLRMWIKFKEENGRKIIDRAAVPAAPARTEQRPIQRYIRYTAGELAAQDAVRKKQKAQEKLPELVDSLAKQVAALQTAQSDTDALCVEQEYRLTLLELGITDTANNATV